MRHISAGILYLAAVASGGVFAQAPPWTQAFDFDGDKVCDVITVEYTGGAHCCYRLAVRLSSTRKTHHLPFLLDGGYVGGLDLSQPSRFAIRHTDGALPEMLMEIETYNGTPLPLPTAWKQHYGINTHFIAVGFAHGELRVRDWPVR